MALTEWQTEFRKSSDFKRIADRIKEDMRSNDSEYKFTSRPENAHGGHNIEESYGDHYCCHTCKVLGVRY